MMMNCLNCGKIFREEDAVIREEDGCVGCGISPCHHCTDSLYICPSCGSEETEELTVDGDYYVRVLDDIPFDKVFYVNGNEELCHSTGIEVCRMTEDPTNYANWFNEYEDSEGEFHYGR